jgi:hypothetical protein
VWENVEEPSMGSAKNFLEDCMVYVCLKCREICEDIERLDKIRTVKFNNFEEKMTTNHNAILKIIKRTEQNYIALTDDLDKTASTLDELRADLLTNKNKSNTSISDEIQFAAMSKLIKSTIEEQLKVFEHNSDPELLLNKIEETMVKYSEVQQTEDSSNCKTKKIMVGE